MLGFFKKDRKEEVSNTPDTSKKPEAKLPLSPSAESKVVPIKTKEASKPEKVMEATKPQVKTEVLETFTSLIRIGGNDNAVKGSVRHYSIKAGDKRVKFIAYGDAAKTPSGVSLLAQVQLCKQGDDVFFKVKPEKNPAKTIEKKINIDHKKSVVTFV